MATTKLQLTVGGLALSGFLLRPELEFFVHQASDVSAHMWLAAFAAACAGFAARRSIPASPWRFALHSFPVVLALGFFAFDVYDSVADAREYEATYGYQGFSYEWRLLVRAMLRASPTLVLIGFVIAARRQTLCLLGAATICCRYGYNVWETLPLLAFLGVRDFATSESETPVRQHAALYAVGALAALYAMALIFDLAATCRLFFPVEEFTAMDFHVDSAAQRWTRIGAEVGLLFSCIAHFRGRTWGVIGLVVIAVPIAIQVCGEDLPFWSRGCMGSAHPLWEMRFFWASLTLGATLPWARPMLKALARSEG